LTNAEEVPPENIGRDGGPCVFLTNGERYSSRYQKHLLKSYSLTKILRKGLEHFQNLQTLKQYKVLRRYYMFTISRHLLYQQNSIRDVKCLDPPNPYRISHPCNTLLLAGSAVSRFVRRHLISKAHGVLDYVRIEAFLRLASWSSRQSTVTPDNFTTRRPMYRAFALVCISRAFPEIPGFARPFSN
jgi:hypothetical protein